MTSNNDLLDPLRRQARTLRKIADTIDDAIDKAERSGDIPQIPDADVLTELIKGNDE